MLLANGHGWNEEGTARVLEMVKNWLHDHAPWHDAINGAPDTRWHSKSPVVRETALDLTHERVKQQAEQIEETLGRLQTELDVVRGRSNRGSGSSGGGTADAAG